jgi:hypothetical protein
MSMIGSFIAFLLEVLVSLVPQGSRRIDRGRAAGGKIPGQQAGRSQDCRRGRADRPGKRRLSEELDDLELFGRDPAEQRDDRNLFFVDQLDKGETVIEYTDRPEMSGAFTALPANASSMYMPELVARSGEARMNVGKK